MVHRVLRFVICSLFFQTFFWGAEAASFDCNKASTETEKGICSDPLLSELDEQIADIYFSLNKEGRYYPRIIEQHKNWLKNERRADEYNMRAQLDFLIYASSINSCLGKDASRSQKMGECISVLNDVAQACMEVENYTTLVMNRCSFSLVRLYELIEEIEFQAWIDENESDTETLILFKEARELWRAFIKADCDWQYSSFRHGTIRGQILAGCLIDHHEDRLLTLTAQWGS